MKQRLKSADMLINLKERLSSLISFCSAATLILVLVFALFGAGVDLYDYHTGSSILTQVSAVRTVAFMFLIPMSVSFGLVVLADSICFVINRYMDINIRQYVLKTKDLKEVGGSKNDLALTTLKGFDQSLSEKVKAEEKDEKGLFVVIGCTADVRDVVYLSRKLGAKVFGITQTDVLPGRFYFTFLSGRDRQRREQISPSCNYYIRS